MIIHGLPWPLSLQILHLRVDFTGFFLYGSMAIPHLPCFSAARISTKRRRGSGHLQMGPRFQSLWGWGMQHVYCIYYVLYTGVYIYWVAEFPGKKKATLFFVLQAPGRAKLLCFVLQQQHCLDPGLISADLKNLAWQVVDLTTEPMTSGLYIIDIWQTCTQTPMMLAALQSSNHFYTSNWAVTSAAVHRSAVGRRSALTHLVILRPCWMANQSYFFWTEIWLQEICSGSRTSIFLGLLALRRNLRKICISVLSKDAANQ